MGSPWANTMPTLNWPCIMPIALFVTESALKNAFIGKLNTLTILFALPLTHCPTCGGPKRQINLGVSLPFVTNGKASIHRDKTSQVICQLRKMEAEVAFSTSPQHCEIQSVEVL